jgi:hypothetical protein
MRHRKKSLRRIGPKILLCNCWSLRKIFERSLVY